MCAVPPEPGKELVPETLKSLEFAVATETHESYFEKLSAMGGVVEEFLDGSAESVTERAVAHESRWKCPAHLDSRSDSAGPSGQVYVGCSFPAHDGYRLQVQELGLADRPHPGESRRRQPLWRGLPRHASDPA